jgi:hypothetical protein
MYISPLFALLPLASAKLLLSYDAAAGDSASILGRQNLGGFNGATWPSGQAHNASAFFTTAKDPNGIPAAHVHKDAHFTRSEYHMLVGQTAADQTYYIGYHVSFGTGADYESCPIVFQWCVLFSPVCNSKLLRIAAGRTIIPILSMPITFLLYLSSARAPLPTGT